MGNDKHCLNCGAELKGAYCHECGQHATKNMHTIVGFFMEYMNTAFIWDSKCLHTIWNLIRRPGYLTSEFLSGKFVSQEHPLKLNMFLLFIFVTLFLIFSGTEKMNSSVHNLTNDERVLHGIQINTLYDDPEYIQKIDQSERDTVKIIAPLFIAEQYPDIIQNIETIKNTDGEALDIWIAAVPKILIDDQIIVPGTEDCYTINTEIQTEHNVIEIFNNIWSAMVNILAKYFPIIVLFTAPLLTVSLRLVQRKSHLPHLHHFIFALHYTAFLELLMLFIYILYLLVSPPLGLLQIIVASGSCIYLTIAFHHVYKMNTWFKAVLKALITSVIYLLISLMIFVTIFMIASITVVAAI